MSCAAPLSFDTLVAYWAGDLPPLEADPIDEHLIGCATCTAAATRLASVVQALRELIPPVVDRATVERLRAAGTRIQENSFFPDQRQSVVFPAGLDILLHRLVGIDLADAERVDVTVRSESTGQILAEVPRAPFDATEGVLIACQVHFRDMAADTVFEVRAITHSGAERVAIYTIPHTFAGSPA